MAIFESKPTRLLKELHSDFDLKNGRLLDRRELAARLAIGDRTIGALVQRHELPPDSPY
jgi:hypothetical protein